MKSIFYSSLFAVIISSILAIDYAEVEEPSKRLYSLTNEFCCNGTIFRNKNSSDYECCGGKMIDKKTEMCCFPESYPREPNVECCGKKSYNTLTHACYRATSTRTRSNSYGVGDRVILPLGVNDSSTCGDKIMNLEKEICCGYQIIPDPEQKMACCGDYNIPYDANTEICCSWYSPNRTIPKIDPKDSLCCGEKSYNLHTHFCSKGGVVADIPKGNFNKCNDTIFDMTKEVCCRDYNRAEVTVKLAPDHDSCCGNVSYNRNDSICCIDKSRYGKPVHKLHNKVENTGRYCCGTKMVDETQKCCFGSKSYDPKSQTCCFSWDPVKNETIVKISDVANGTCCRSDVIDEAKEECCGFSIIPKSPDGKSGCCMHTINSIGYTESQHRWGFTRIFSAN